MNMQEMLRTAQPTVAQHTEAQRAHALEMINVSQGITRPSEVALWVGKSTLLHPKNQTRLVMGVSRDKDWFWLRFSHDLKPEDNARLTAEGFSYSKKTRLGYSCASSPAVAKFIRQLGFDKCAHFTYVKPVEPVAKQAAVSTPNEGVAKGKTTTKETHMLDGITYNPVSKRWVNSQGVFVKAPTGTVKVNGKVVQAQEVAATPVKGGLDPYELGRIMGKSDKVRGLTMAPSVLYTGEEQTQYVLGYVQGYTVEYVEGVSPKEYLTVTQGSAPEEPGITSWLDVTDDGESVNADQYQDGYDAGVCDGEDETVPGIYDVDALARYMGMTVTELHASVGTSFVDGWMTGFAETRPAPARKGIKAIFSK